MSSKGEPLFRFYSPQIQLAQADLLVAMRAEAVQGRGEPKCSPAPCRRLRNLDVPDSRIDEVRKTMTNPRTTRLGLRPRPATSIEKKVIEGQRVMAGDELFRIADHSRVWVDRRSCRVRHRR